MSVARIILRSSRAAPRACERRFSSAPFKQIELNKRGNDTADEYRKIMKEKPLNPHMTNTTSTIANELPSIGKDNAPPELISSVDGDFVPKDARPENTEKMTGGTQSGEPSSGVNADLAVGEIEGGTFRVEPLRRTGEDDNTMRARLLYQSRKRGTLESDLLFSTFADENLGKMNTRQLQEYDAFLDENDWDLYYWATQQAPQTSMAYAEGAGPGMATKDVQGKDLAPDGGPVSQTDAWRNGEARSGEWANTVGKFRAQYRPVPARWKHSSILSMVRKHVIDRSAGGVHIVGEEVDESTPRKGGGLGFMPELKNFDR